MLHVEIECKKAKGYAWSALLTNAGRTIIAAKWHLSAVLNGRLQIQLMDHACAIIDAKCQLKEAYTILRHIQKHAKQIRDSFVEDHAEHLVNTREITKVATVQQILHAEHQMITFWKLRKWLKGNEYAQLTHVLIPDEPDNLTHTTWTLIVDAQKLYRILTKEGQLHYHQAAETPLVCGPFAEKIGLFDDNEYCDTILHGTFDMSHLTTVSKVRDIIAGMCYPDPTKPTLSFDYTITDDDFFQAVFHTRE